MPFAVQLALVPDLIRELYKVIAQTVRAGQGLSQQEGARLHCRQIETHIQVGCARAALHVEHPHGMFGVVLEDILSGFVLSKDLRQPGLDLCFRHSPGDVIVPESIIKRRVAIGAGDLAGAEVHRTDLGAVNAAEIDHKLAVHIQPEIVISGEFKDNVVPPGIQAAGCLGEACLHLHTEEVVDTLAVLITIFIAPTLIVIADQVKVLPLPGIEIRKLLRQHIRLIGDIFSARTDSISFLRGNRIVGHELSVCTSRSGFTAACDRADLVIDREISAVLIQMSKVLGAVILKISALIVDTLNKQVVDIDRRLCFFDQLREGLPDSFLTCL